MGLVYYVGKYTSPMDSMGNLITQQRISQEHFWCALVVQTRALETESQVRRWDDGTMLDDWMFQLSFGKKPKKPETNISRHSFP